MSKAALKSINGEDAKLREFVNGVLTSLNAMDASALGEPFLGKFNELKEAYNSILSQLPPTDQVPAAHEASYSLASILSCLMNTQALFTLMGQRLADLKSSRNSADDAAAIQKLVSDQIEVAVKSGDLFQKDMVTTMCSQARTDGVAEGEKKVADRIEAEAVQVKLIEARKALLATNSLPLPKDDALLAGTDAEFEARLATAKTRCAALTAKKLALNSPLMADVWIDEAGFKLIENAVSVLVATSSAAPAGGEIFARPPGNTKPSSLFVL